MARKVNRGLRRAIGGGLLTAVSVTGTAFATVSTLKLSGPTTVSSGTRIAIKATGNAGKATELIGFETPNVPCKSTETAERAAGEGVVGPDPVHGKFTNTKEFVFNSGAPGKKLLCAYLYGGRNDTTYARASWSWTITS